MKVTTFNVNSVKARLPRIVEWIKATNPDVVLLQEIKTQTDTFPYTEFEELGYNAAVFGQKAYNGVAILSTYQIKDVLKGLPGSQGDEQARYIEATINDTRIASIYLPNGNPVDSDKYPYKLAWMDRLTTHVRETLLPSEEPFILGGDYNVIPTDLDVYDPTEWNDDALCRPETRERFRALLHLGLTEAWRALNKNISEYSFWDYQKGRWSRDEGLRIDFLLLSPQMADRLVTCQIDRAPRGKERASDHTPVWCEIL